MNFTITLSELELKALQYVAYDAQEWIENAVKSRCILALDELVKDTIEYNLSLGGSVNGTKEEIALSSKLPSAKDRHDVYIENLTKSIPDETDETDINSI